MSKKIPTSQRIIDAGRWLFNERGYAATTLNEIAAKVGISQGNLSYYFPTKLDLARRIEADTRAQAQLQRGQQRTGSVADDYVNHVLFAMNLMWANRFLLRDRAQFETSPEQHREELAADFELFLALLKRAEESALIRRSATGDIHELARALWIVGRYWMDYLQECEGRDEISWEDQARGIELQFALLRPCLTASAYKQFEAALARAKSAPDTTQIQSTSS